MSSTSDASREGSRTYSVVIPTSRRPELLLLAIDSVRKQTYSPIEIIVVDNDPDRSAEAVLRQVTQEDGRVRYLAASTIRGPSHARNVGVGQAKGEFIAFLDDDDLWRPEFLDHVDAEIQRQPLQLVLGWFDVLQGGRTGPGKGIQPGIPLSVLLRSGNQGITGSNIVIDRGLFDAIGGFDEELEYSEDRDFLIRLVARGDVYGVVRDRDVVHRVHDGTQLSDLGDERRLVSATRFYEKHRAQMPLLVRRLRIKDLHYTASHTRDALLARVYHGLVASLLGDRRPLKEVVLRLIGRTRPI